ncbi:MAG: YmdB family metallophosphoesterase [Dysosmobacter sp.]
MPTADERVYPKGTGYITDLGMTGAVESCWASNPGSRWRPFWADCRAGTRRPRARPSSRGRCSPWTAPQDCAPRWSGWTSDEKKRREEKPSCPLKKSERISSLSASRTASGSFPCPPPRWSWRRWPWGWRAPASPRA